jgi:hypothetical protein
VGKPLDICGNMLNFKHEGTSATLCIASNGRLISAKWKLPQSAAVVVRLLCYRPEKLRSKYFRESKHCFNTHYKISSYLSNRFTVDQHRDIARGRFSVQISYASILRVYS